MTGTLPYHTKKRETALTKAIGEGDLPADKTISIKPDFVRDILNRCWQREPRSRLQSVYCPYLLSYRTSSVVGVFSAIPVDLVPQPDVIKGDGWRAISDPDLGQPYSCLFLPISKGLTFDTYVNHDAYFLPSTRR